MQLIEGNGKKGLLSYEFCRSVAAIGTGLSTFAASIALLDSGISAAVIGGIVAVSQYAMTRQRQEDSALALNISQAALAAVVSNAVVAALANGVPTAQTNPLTRPKLPDLAQERVAHDITDLALSSLRNGFTLTASADTPGKYRASVTTVPQAGESRASKKAATAVPPTARQA